MGRRADVVIAGGGLAAQRCAETLRRLGYDGSIVMICEEPHAPYDRPPLSKGVLTGERAPETLRLRPLDWYAAHGVELRAGAAQALESSTREVRLRDGSRLRYGQLVVATGSRPRELASFPVGGDVRQLRSLDDAIALRVALAAGAARIVIVGAGLIGMEVASSVAALGLQVTLIEAAKTPLPGVLPPALGRWLLGLHRHAGINVRLAAEVCGLDESHGTTAVRLREGDTIPADLVLVAAGVLPAIGWLAETPLGRGPLIVDHSGRTCLPRVYAAGDAACFPDSFSGRHLPTPHWESAARQGAVVAHAILGRQPPASPASMFWSDQHGVRIQVVGHGHNAQRLEIDGDPATHDFTAWMIRDGRPVAAVLVNRPRALPEARRRIATAALGQRDREAA